MGKISRIASFYGFEIWRSRLAHDASSRMATDGREVRPVSGETSNEAGVEFI